MGYTPSHRNTLEPQPEVCFLCGALVPASRLIESDVEGLRGAKVCDLHPFEAVARLKPSYHDLQPLHPAPNLAAEETLQISGAALWFRTGDEPEADPPSLLDEIPPEE